MRPAFVLSAPSRDLPHSWIAAVCILVAALALALPSAAQASLALLKPSPSDTGKRAIWELGQVTLNDGGSDGVVATLPNDGFMVQQVFVP
jgi:hypothetical protein